MVTKCVGCQSVGNWGLMGETMSIYDEDYCFIRICSGCTVRKFISKINPKAL